MNRVYCIGFLCLVMFASSIAGLAQATTSLRGSVKDVSGAVVPNASITLSDPSTQFSRTTSSDRRRISVPPGSSGHLYVGSKVRRLPRVQGDPPAIARQPSRHL